MGHSYKGSSVAPGSTQLAVGAVLSAIGSGSTSWTYSSGNPPQWRMFHATSPTGPFTLFGTFAGTARGDSSENPGDYVYLVGTAPSGYAVTQQSNTVLVT